MAAPPPPPPTDPPPPLPIPSPASCFRPIPFRFVRPASPRFVPRANRRDGERKPGRRAPGHSNGSRRAARPRSQGSRGEICHQVRSADCESLWENETEIGRREWELIGVTRLFCCCCVSTSRSLRGRVDGADKETESLINLSLISHLGLAAALGV